MKKPHDLFLTSSLLIADQSSVRRERIKRLALELGFSDPNIFSSSNGEEAFSVASENDIGMAIVDDSLGFEALSRLHAHFELKQIQDPNALLFFVSEVASKGIVGRIAEEDVDDFIFRPYSASHFKEVFEKAVERKLNPSATQVRLIEGRAALADGRIEEAKKIFEAALPDSGSRMATLCYYLGQTAMAEKKYSDAAKRFNAGLSSNPIHFRCLKGLFELRMAESRIDEAYQALKHVSEAYPENPERLIQLVKMAVANAHYRDIEKLDALYVPMELKDRGVKKHLAAGLAVLGRSLCVQKNLEPALKALTRSIELSDAVPDFVDYAIESLEKYNFQSDADIFRKKYNRPAAADLKAA